MCIMDVKFVSYTITNLPNFKKTQIKSLALVLLFKHPFADTSLGTACLP